MKRLFYTSRSPPPPPPPADPNLNFKTWARTGKYCMHPKLLQQQLTTPLQQSPPVALQGLPTKCTCRVSDDYLLRPDATGRHSSAPSACLRHPRRGSPRWHVVDSVAVIDGVPGVNIREKARREGTGTGGGASDLRWWSYAVQQRSKATAFQRLREAVQSSGV